MEPARLSATDLACRRGDRLLFRGLSFELGAAEGQLAVEREPFVEQRHLSLTLDRPGGRA